MYTVALIQNQSEMTHYSHADARPMLDDLGYGYTLYTATNIHLLANDLEQLFFDGIILASNALNDKTIRGEFKEKKTIRNLSKFLQSGKGLLICLQLRLAQDQDAIELIDGFIGPIAGQTRDEAEHAEDGTLRVPKSSENHTALLYPNKIKVSDVEHSAKHFSSLPGLYWHYWKSISAAEWDILLEDEPARQDQRPLLICSKGSFDFRIIASAMPIDWQKQRELFQNCLVQTVEGRHNTAILANQANRNTAFEYLLATLRARKFPHRLYYLDQDLTELSRHIANGVHANLVFGPFVGKSNLPKDLADRVEEKVNEGRLKVLSVEDIDDGIGQFSVAGRERFATRLLQFVELRVQEELRVGYIDGSFWSTVETLTNIKNIEEIGSEVDILASRAKKKINEHDRNGSYDEVFGATCALCWFRSQFSGNDSADTKETIEWLRNKIDRYETREQLQALHTFAICGIINKEEEKRLWGILRSANVDLLSEVDLLVYLNASLSIGAAEIWPAIITALDRRKVGGLWVDLATTATVTTLLIDTLLALRSRGGADANVLRRVEALIFLGMIEIQRGYQSDSGQVPNKTLWDGKTSTTIKCVRAWLNFDALLDFPVYEFVDVISKYSTVSNSLIAGRQSLQLLEEMRRENQTIFDENEKMKTENKRAKRMSRFGRWSIFSCIFCVYCLAATIFLLMSQVGFSNSLPVIGKGLIDSWGLHLTVIGLLLAALAVPWNTVLRYIDRGANG